MTAFQSRTSAERLRRLNARRKGLLLSCAFGTAVALAAQPDAASAQAIQANMDFNPNATRITTSGTSETISVSNPSTVINWSPTSTPTGDYEFLPAGNTVTFQHGGGDFAVLNRINIPQRVRFDGTVISQIIDPLSGAGTRGGTILFSAPSGIIIGSSAVFDVGSLVLTTLEVNNLGGDDGYGNFDFVNADGSIGFFNPEGAGGIITEAGSQIRTNGAPGGFTALIAPNIDHSGSILASGAAALLGADEATIDLTPGQFRISTSYSYSSDSVITRSGSLIDVTSAPGGRVALVAPIIDHGGAIRVDGQAALVSGRSVEISLSAANGLFNIAVPAGVSTSNDNPGSISVTGSIGGPASTGAGDPHRIYVVGIARPFDEDPITILLNGSIGFDPAGASVQNGQIVISSGYEVTDGAINPDVTRQEIDGPCCTAPPGPGNIRIDGGTFTSDIDAAAYGSIAIHGGTFTSMTARATGSTDPANPEAFLADTANAPIDFSGNLSVTVGGEFNPYSYVDTYGGFARLTANNGRDIHIGGDLSILSKGSSGSGSSAFGGEIDISADEGGSIRVDGDAHLNAAAAGVELGYGSGGSASGGGVFLSAAAGGTVQISGSVDVDVSGTGAPSTGYTYGYAGDGRGGIVGVYSDGGTVTIGGALAIDATGTGGAAPGPLSGSRTGAYGSGGSVTVRSTGDGAITVNGSTTILASGTGGALDGGSSSDNQGGQGSGGFVAISARDDGSTVSLNNGIGAIDVSGHGGDGPIGGRAFGGTTIVTAQSPGANLTLGGLIAIDASGKGGQGLASNGGDGLGGFVSFSADSGGIGFDTITADASGIGGNGVATGGDGFGGGDGPQFEGSNGIYFHASNGGVLGGRFATLTANGRGGAASDGSGGRATGGTAEFYAFNGDSSSLITLTSGTIDVSAVGSSGANGGAGGSAVGGSAAAIAESLNGSLTPTSLSIDATARGGAGGASATGAGGAGGDATGGRIQIGLLSGFGDGAADGAFVATGTTSADASATGGAGGNGSTTANGGSGGSAVGGDLSFSGEGGVMTTGDVVLTATGTGGNAGAGGDGGAGAGGTANLNLTVRTAQNPPSFRIGPQASSDGVSAIIASYTASANGIAGTGVNDGVSTYGTLGFDVTSSRVQFGTIALSLVGDGPADPADTTTINVNDSQFDITDGFSLTTPGLVDIEVVNSLATDNGDFDVSARGVTFNALTSSFEVQGDASFNLAGGVLGQPLTGNAFTLVADASSVDFLGQLAIDVSATGSNGDGGSISVETRNDSLFSAGTSNWRAVGTGTSGGSGTGGSILVTAGSGSTVDLGGGSITANGIGGNGGSGAGGNGRGGSILVTALAGSTVAATGLSLSASGIGGNGFGGGGGLGGTVLVQASGGTLDFAGTVSLAATGIGGGGSPGAGGSGVGNLAEVRVDEGGSLTFDQLVIDATGIGGNGSVGGAGFGGFSDAAPQEIAGGAFFLVAGGTATGNNVTLAAAGIGGDGLGGAGGDGLGGFAQLGDLGGDVASDIDIGAASIDLSGFGGAGGLESEGNGADGGNALGGDVRVLAANGTLRIGALNVVATATGGQGGDGVVTPAGPGTGGAGGSAAGGTILVGTSAATGNAAFDIVSLDGSARGGNGGDGAAADGGGRGGDGRARVVQLVANGGTINAGNVELTAGGTGGAGGAGEIGGVGAGGLAGTDLTGGADATVDSLNVSASGLAGGGTTSDGSQYGQILIGVDSSSLTLGQAVLSAFGQSPSEDFSGPSGLSVNGGQVTITDSLSLSTPGEIDVSGNGTVSGAGNALFSADRISFSDGATVNLSAIDATAFGDIVVGEGATVQAASNVNFFAGGTAQIAGRVSGDGINISSADIDIVDSGFLGGAGTGTINLDVNPGGGQTVIGGNEDGPGYTLDNGEAQRIRAATLRITVPVTGTSATRAPDVLIRDLTLNGTPSQTGNGAIGTLEIDVGGGLASGSGGIRPAAAPQPGEGIARIEGDVLIRNATADNRILIEADGLLTMVTPDGSLRIQDSAGNPTGLIGLASNNIWVGTQGLLDQLAADANFSGRDAALLTNDGEEVPRGYIEGGDVQMFVRDTLFVQNSGNADTFGGITVTGDLAITPSGSSPLDVRAFGRRLNPDGSFETNSDFFRTVAFEQGYGGGFTSGAQFNLCEIASGVCPGEVVEPEQPIQPPTSDQIEEPVEGTGDEPTQPVVNVNAEFDENSVFDSNELIEEPVTSGGDTGLWSENRDCGERDENCAQDGNGQGSGNPGGGSNGN